MKMWPLRNARGAQSAPTGWGRPSIHARWVSTTLLGALLLLAGHARASDVCSEASTLADYPPTVGLRVDNDLFANQDQGYTSGVQLSLTSPNLVDYVDDPCLPAPARWLNRYLEFIQPDGFDQQNMVVTVEQSIFTPSDPMRTDLIVDDRPYAGALLLGLGYNARKGDDLRTSQLVVGMVGPAALAEQSQDFIHDILDAEKFQGWDNQLHNEPVLMLVHERIRRLPAMPIGNSGLAWDANVHAGAALGNLYTHANTGFEVRIGLRLPDDFGTSPVRPTGNNTSPTIGRRFTNGWSWHAFLATDARWVGRNISLDGNTFRDSHGVERQPWVADAAMGAAVIYGRTKFAFARYFRTREFEGQRDTPSYGSFTISRAF